MAEPTDVIGVLRIHLDEVHAALVNARSVQECSDLAEALRHGKGQVKPSWLSKSLTGAIEHIEGYLEVEDVSEEESIQSK